MEYKLDNNKVFKNCIKKHELKQVCAWVNGPIITRIYVTTKEPAPSYFKSVWSLDQDDKLKVTNWAMSLDDALAAVHKRYPKEVRDTRLMDYTALLVESNNISSGKVPGSMDLRKWHKLRADIIRFMLKDVRVPEECTHKENSDGNN